MVKVNRTKTAPASLAIEKEKGTENYRERDVVFQLNKDFNGKCYLCEIDKLQSIHIEHLKPHHGKDRDLMFDWNNLFLSCPHCNSVKNQKKYEEHIIGIGSHNAKGEVCVCRNATEAAKKFKPGQILVVPFTTNDTLPFMREAAGIITEEAGTNSHSAIVGLTLDKAVIVGATNATRTLKDGMTISMDCARGVVQAMAK
jgi:uncharacterized protein (TIGR02646 family)